MDVADAGRPVSYQERNIIVLGLARQGMAAARFFLAAGANVTVSDLLPAAALTAPIAELELYSAGLNGRAGRLSFSLGAHPIELLDAADLVCLSGGVSPSIPFAEAARARGISLVNDAILTLRHSPAPVIAVTGSAGKTTTTTLVGLILQEAGFSVHVGGNIGLPLLDRLDSVSPGDKLLLELSSFQLELCDRSPSLAAVLNITPNHLDRHRSMSHYAAAKANILRYQGSGDTCVLGADDPFTGSWLASGRCFIGSDEGQAEVYFPLPATRLGFSLEREVAAGGFLRGGRLLLRRPGLPDTDICGEAEVRLRGRHNLANLLAACCLAAAAGAAPEAMAVVARRFGGVEHRLEIVRRTRGVTWVNDSIATAPERTIAALRSFHEPLVVLLGGRDKNLPWDGCAAELHRRRADGTPAVRGVVLFGEAAELIGGALARYEAESGSAALPVIGCGDLPCAVAAAAAMAQAGDVALLSPGGTSFDAYQDFAERGQCFRNLVELLP